jgi:hypothetical protein
LRAKFMIMGYLSQRYPDSMANFYYNNNFYKDVVRDTKIPSSAEFQGYRQIMQTTLQEMLQTRKMMERMLMGPIRNHRYNDTHVDYGIGVRPTRHQRLAHKPTTGL